MRRRARGIVGLVVLGLGLGVVTTYGVAWWLLNSVVLPDPRRDIMSILSGGATGWYVWTDPGIGWHRCISCVLQPGESGVDLTSRTKRLPTWSVVSQGSPNELLAGVGMRVDLGFLIEVAAGWPRSAVVRREFLSRSMALPIPVLDHGLTIRRKNPADPMRDTVFVFMPEWPGFTLDVLVYGSVWASILVGVGVVQRRMRMRAGRCARCRYDLSGLAGGVCPECGSAVKGT